MPEQSTIDRYLAAALGLLPPGKAFTQALSSAIASLLEGAMVEFARIDEEAANIYANRTPGKAVDYLDAWEELLGLPETCGLPVPTEVEDRQAAIIEKLRGVSDLSRTAYDAIAARMNLLIDTVTYYKPFEVGSSAVGEPLYGDPWLHTVLLTMSEIVEGDSPPGAGSIWQCLMETRPLKRAHTLVTFEFV